MIISKHRYIEIDIEHLNLTPFFITGVWHNRFFYQTPLFPLINTLNSLEKVMCWHRTFPTELWDWISSLSKVFVKPPVTNLSKLNFFHYTVRRLVLFEVSAKIQADTAWSIAIHHFFAWQAETKVGGITSFIILSVHIACQYLSTWPASLNIPKGIKARVYSCLAYQRQF